MDNDSNPFATPASVQMENNGLKVMVSLDPNTPEELSFMAYFRKGFRTSKQKRVTNPDGSVQFVWM